MFCQFCGATIRDGNQFCPKCGKSVAQSRGTTQGNQGAYYNGANQRTVNTRQPGPQQYVQRQQFVNSQGGAPTGSANGAIPKETLLRQAEQEGWSMAWYKFIIYFSLFAYAVLCFGQGMRLIMGLPYQGEDFDASYVYAMAPELRTLDMAYAIANIAMGAFAIFTRMELTNFKKRGPILLYVANILGAIIPMIYQSRFDSILLVDSGPQDVTTLVATIGLLVVNITYFTKRKHLFVNN